MHRTCHISEFSTGCLSDMPNENTASKLLYSSLKTKFKLSTILRNKARIPGHGFGHIRPSVQICLNAATHRDLFLPLLQPFTQIWWIAVVAIPPYGPWSQLFRLPGSAKSMLSWTKRACNRQYGVSPSFLAAESRASLRAVR